MLLSLSLIFLVGMSAAAVCKKLKLPGLIGMLITGIVLGPYVLDLLDPSILGISSELRQIALIIILIRAGLSLNISDLKKVGRPALLMSFVPACFEILGYVLLAPALLGLSRIEAAVTGAVLGAVSPAAVVPRTIKLTEEGCGVDKSIPQMIMAGGVLRRYIRHSAVFRICGHGTGGGSVSFELCGHSHIHRFGNRRRSCFWICTVFSV